MEKIMMERRRFLKFAGATVLTGPLAGLFPRTLPESVAAPNAGSSLQVGGLPANWGALHWQWTWPCWLPDAGRQFNVQTFVSGLLAAGIQVVHIPTRLELGLWYFPTKIGYERECSGRNWVLEILEEIRRQGAEDRLKVLLYFSASLDNSAAAQEPTWRQVDADDNPLYISGFGGRLWDYVCLNSPWRAYCYSVMNETAELFADRYPSVIGFWVDEPHFAPYGCYCMWCQEGFSRQYGAELPRLGQGGRDLWSKMRQFQVDSVLRFLDDVNNEVIPNYPDLIWSWNGLSHPATWEPRVWRISSFNSIEGEPGYLWALAWSKQMVSYGRPFEIAFGRDTGWTDQRPRPPQALKTLQAIGLAHGGAVLIGDYPYPNGKMRASGFTWTNDLYGWKNSIQPWLDEAKNLSEVALFDSWDSNWVRFLYTIDETSGMWGGNNPPNTSFYVWARLLAEANIQFDVVTESNLDALSRYKAIILPDLLHLSDAAIQALDRYVQAGGNILSTYRTAFFDRNGVERPSAAFYNLLGVRFLRWSNFQGTYLWIDDAVLKRELSLEPMLILGPAMLCEATTAQPLAWVTFPIDEVTETRRVWFDYNPPRDNHESYPSVALNRRGQGQVLSIFHHLEVSLRKEEYWAPEQLLLNALTRLLPDRLIKITASGEVVAITTIQEANRRVVLHLLNEAVWTGSRFLTEPNCEAQLGKQGPFPWKRPVVANVQVELKVPFGSVARVYEAPSRRDISFQYMEGGVIRFTVPGVDTHTVVVVEAPAS